MTETHRQERSRRRMETARTREHPLAALLGPPFDGDLHRLFRIVTPEGWGLLVPVGPLRECTRLEENDCNDHARRCVVAPGVETRIRDKPSGTSAVVGGVIREGSANVPSFTV